MIPLTTKNFIPSPHQLAIFSAIPRENIIVHAVAGSGKTTTIVEALKLLPKTDPGGILPPSSLFLAFNKSIADVLRTRCPSTVQCKTFHALGLAALKRVCDPSHTSRKDWVDGSKVRKLSYSILQRDEPDREAIWKLVSLTKSVPRAPQDWTTQQLLEVADYFQLTLEDSRFVTDTVLRLAERSFNDRSSIDFDDMLYLPVLLNASFDPQDYIFVDEAQDTNDIQLEILDRLRVSNRPDEQYSPTRLCAVGDPNQAIYGFRGANADSMDKIASRFSCTPYPLSVSWRCSVAAVDEARRVLAMKF